MIAIVVDAVEVPTARVPNVEKLPVAAVVVALPFNNKAPVSDCVVEDAKAIVVRPKMLAAPLTVKLLLLAEPCVAKFPLEPVVVA